MADRKNLVLVQRLYQQTQKGKITWTETNQDRAFRAKLGTFSVIVREIDDPEYPDIPDYQVELYNDKNRWIESISNSDLRAFGEEKLDDLTPYAVMSATYRLAHRQALGIDKVIDSILAQLESM